MRRIAACIAAFALLLAACGGGGNKLTGSKSSNNGSSGSSTDSFQNLLNQQNKAKIRVTYQSGSDTFTISRDGNGNVAYITSDSQTIVKSDGTTTTCTGMPDETSCTTVTGDAAKAALLPFTGILDLAATEIKSAHDAGGIGKESSENIAGRDATCVTVTLGSALGKVGGAIAGASGADTSAGYKACADKQTGILLLWEGVGSASDNSNKIEATQVGEPQDSDFVPPSTTSTTGDSTDQSTDTSGSSETSTTSGGSSSGSTTCSVGGVTITIPTLPGGSTVPCPTTG